MGNWKLSTANFRAEALRNRNQTSQKLGNQLLRSPENTNVSINCPTGPTSQKLESNFSEVAKLTESVMEVTIKVVETPVF